MKRTLLAFLITSFGAAGFGGAVQAGPDLPDPPRIGDLPDPPGPAPRPGELPDPPGFDDDDFLDPLGLFDDDDDHRKFGHPGKHKGHKRKHKKRKN